MDRAGRRRNASRVDKTRALLDEIKNSRQTGKKQIDWDEHKDSEREQGVYDVVNEREYAAVVKKRREEAGK